MIALKFVCSPVHLKPLNVPGIGLDAPVNSFHLPPSSGFPDARRGLHGINLEACCF